MGDDFSCARLIFGEADQFPGLTVDLLGHSGHGGSSLGMEVRKSLLYSLLVELLAGYGVAVRAIYERTRPPAGQGAAPGEGSIPPRPGHRPDATSPWWKTESPTMWTTSTAKRPGFSGPEIQPPGRCGPGSRPADSWTAAHTGAFALTALPGAAHVTAVDISQDAVASPGATWSAMA